MVAVWHPPPVFWRKGTGEARDWRDRPIGRDWERRGWGCAERAEDTGAGGSAGSGNFLGQSYRGAIRGRVGTGGTAGRDCCSETIRMTTKRASQSWGECRAGGDGAQGRHDRATLPCGGGFTGSGHPHGPTGFPLPVSVHRRVGRRVAFALSQPQCTRSRDVPGTSALADLSGACRYAHVTPGCVAARSTRAAWAWSGW